MTHVSDVNETRRRPRRGRGWWRGAALAGMAGLMAVAVAACGSGQSAGSSAATPKGTGTSYAAAIAGPCPTGGADVHRTVKCSVAVETGPGFERCLIRHGVNPMYPTKKATRAQQRAQEAAIEACVRPLLKASHLP